MPGDPSDAPQWRPLSAGADLSTPDAQRVRAWIRDTLVLSSGVSHDDVEAAGWRATADLDASFGIWIATYEGLLAARTASTETK